MTRGKMFKHYLFPFKPITRTKLLSSFGFVVPHGNYSCRQNNHLLKPKADIKFQPEIHSNDTSIKGRYFVKLLYLLYICTYNAYTIKR